MLPMNLVFLLASYRLVTFTFFPPVHQFIDCTLPCVALSHLHVQYLAYPLHACTLRMMMETKRRPEIESSKGTLCLACLGLFSFFRFSFENTTIGNFNWYIGIIALRLKVCTLLFPFYLRISFYIYVTEEKKHTNQSHKGLRWKIRVGVHSIFLQCLHNRWRLVCVPLQSFLVVFLFVFVSLYRSPGWSTNNAFLFIYILLF